MKNFLKHITTALGITLGFFLFVGIIIATLAISFQKSRKHTMSLKPKTILRIRLKGNVEENCAPPILPYLASGAQPKAIDCLELKKILEQAAQDGHIAGIYLDMGAVVAGWSTLTELRNALLAFKKSGKVVVAYGENFTNKNYYLASLADALVWHPGGNFIFIGMDVQLLFFKDFLDRLGIVPEIFRVGKYKSAVEPFLQTHMSEASKRQSNLLLQTIYHHFLETISQARTIPVDELKAMANNLTVTQPEHAYKSGLVSHLGFAQDLENWLREKLDVALDAPLNYVDYEQYPRTTSTASKAKKQVAVFFAHGEIVEEGLGHNYIVAEKFLKTLDELQADPKVQAIVLRINSPGGSATASETIWQALRKSKKPIVASMGDAAASGGYYMAAGCHYILAHPTTITGSIGIFGLYFQIQEFLQQKIGIYSDGVKTAPSADIFNFTRPFTMPEKQIIQNHIERGYDRFLHHVAIGRKVEKTAIAKIAEGRVWPGTLAQQKGLIDELGDLDAAIKKAAHLAELPEAAYEVVYWPKRSTLWSQLMVETRTWYQRHLQKEIENTPYYGILQQAAAGLRYQGIQTILPYTLTIN